MSEDHHIKQINVFGENIVTTYADREFSEADGAELLAALPEGVRHIGVHYEHDGETRDLVERIVSFLRQSGYTTTLTQHQGSGIPRRAFQVEAEPGAEVALLRIGTR